MRPIVSQSQVSSVYQWSSQLSPPKELRASSSCVDGRFIAVAQSRYNYQRVLFKRLVGVVSGERARRAVDAATRHLLVPGAMRTLAPLPANARDELRSELGPEYADLELTDLDPRAIVRKHIAEAMAELDELEDSIRADEPEPERQRPLEVGETPPYDLDAT